MPGKISVKMGDVLKDELEYENIEDHYWTDSKVVLGFIGNESSRFHVYVANRVQLIHDHTTPSPGTAQREGLGGL